MLQKTSEKVEILFSFQSSCPSPPGFYGGAVTVVLLDLLKKLSDAKVQFLHNWFEPQTDIVRRNQRPEENGNDCRQKSEFLSTRVKTAMTTSAGPVLTESIGQEHPRNIAPQQGEEGAQAADQQAELGRQMRAGW